MIIIIIIVIIIIIITVIIIMIFCIIIIIIIIIIIGDKILIWKNKIIDVVEIMEIINYGQQNNTERPIISLFTSI